MSNTASDRFDEIHDYLFRGEVAPRSVDFDRASWMASEIRRLRSKADEYRGWTERLLRISEYLGLLPSSAQAWMCGFCKGYSYENLDGDVDDEGVISYTPPTSNWHQRECPVLKIRASLNE